MLIHLSIQNFAVVRQLSVPFEQGMTAVTGETGAGKSILIDALGLCLGDRADAGMVRGDANKAEVVAHFSLLDLAQAKQWLVDNELLDEDEPDTVFIRRVISREGRSKAFINGVPVSLQQVKQLGPKLLSIHGQNTHLQLLKEDTQRHLLDSYAGHAALLTSTERHYQEWRALERELQSLQSAEQMRRDRQQLLNYQVSELDEFALADGEFSELESEHRRLSHGQTLLEQAQTSFYQLYDQDDGNAHSVIQSSIDKLEALVEHDSTLQPIVEMLNSAVIQIEEASQELRQYCDHLEIDPLRLQQVEQRYSTAMTLARKHSVEPELLYAHHQTLSAELSQLSDDEERLEGLSESVSAAFNRYVETAQTLHDSRQRAAARFADEITQSVRQMNMPHAEVEFALEFDAHARPSAHGLNSVDLLVTTNAGQAKDKLEKVVSGGELSRIGLAVQVIANDDEAAGTMIFDEVDTGISGPTAALVGQLLRKLGHGRQVMCVTHLPQVAARAHHQLFVAKHSDGKTTETQILALTEQARVDELARLLAGDTISESALANARELLASAQVAEA